MAICLVKGSSVARNRSHRGLGGIADERSCRECAPPPSEATPKGSSHLPAVCATLGQFDHFVALALQQNGQQSALCKGQVRFCHNEVFSIFHKRLLIEGLTVLPTDSYMGPSSYAFRGISDLLMSIDLYEVRQRKDYRGVDLIFDALCENKKTTLRGVRLKRLPGGAYPAFTLSPPTQRKCNSIHTRYFLLSLHAPALHTAAQIPAHYKCLSQS